MSNHQQLIYWRRRLLALILGLTALGLVTWAISGAIGPAGSARPVGSALATGPAGGPAATGTGAAIPSASSSATAGPSSARPASPGYCWRDWIVLSLSASQARYGRAQLPQFDVDVVSTGAGTCLFNVGADDVVLVIYSGSRQVWSSADCVAGSGSLVISLQKGVPTVLPISWDRRASVSGCPADTSLGPAGTYSATVRDGSLASNSVTFRMA
ncbi:MAG: hypothetical protein ABSD40_07105 [Streptosporangiaceae bacterium]